MLWWDFVKLMHGQKWVYLACVRECIYEIDKVHVIAPLPTTPLSTLLRETIAEQGGLQAAKIV